MIFIMSTNMEREERDIQDKGKRESGDFPYVKKCPSSLRWFFVPNHYSKPIGNNFYVCIKCGLIWEDLSVLSFSGLRDIGYIDPNSESLNYRR
jgi:hypothetical protein